MSIIEEAFARGNMVDETSFQYCLLYHFDKFDTNRMTEKGRETWERVDGDFYLSGSDLTATSFWRSFVGPDWIATMFVLGNPLNYEEYRVSKLRIRGNRAAAESTLMHTYLKCM